MPESDEITRGWLRRHLAWSNSRQSWEERVGLAAILSVGALLLWFGTHIPLPTQVFAWGLLLAVSALLLRRGWLKLFGPILFYDLVRIARQRRYYWLRALYAVLLAATLGWVYWTWTLHYRYAATGMQAKDMTVFAESFFYTFMFIQLVVVAILTPAYTAGAIAEEKDRKTLEFILATDLRNREIVLSKLISRIVNLTLLIMAGLPVLSFLQFLGGIDPNLVLAGFAATGLTMVSLASLSILNSVMAKRPRDAIALTYFQAIAYSCLSGVSWSLLIPTLGIANFPSTDNWTSPVTVGDLVHWFNAGNLVAAIIQLVQAVGFGKSIASALPDLLWSYAIFHGCVTLTCTAWSIWRIRAITIRQAHGETRKQSARTRLFPRPSMGSQPMLWKEIFAEPGVRFNVFSRVFMVLLVAASFVPVGLILYFYVTERGPRSWFDLAGAMNVWVRIAGAAVACLLLLAVASRAASSISNERDRQTLDGLLASPLASNNIIFAKWLGNILSIRWGWLWLGLIYLAGLITEGLHPIAVVLLVVAWFIYASVVSGIGLWFSIVSKTTLRATVWTLLVTTAAGVGHWILWMCCTPFFFIGGGGPPAKIVETLSKLQAGVTPPIAMGGFFSFSQQNLQRGPYSQPEAIELIGYGLFGLVCWLIVAAVLWFVTSEAFRTTSGRNPLRQRDDPRFRARPKLQEAPTMESVPYADPME
jgi:ABC-type transport system involved in multi-copper enzyme maturation permease subunit